MKNIFIYSLITTLLLTGTVIISCTKPEPDVPIYTYSPDFDKQEENNNTTPAPTTNKPPALQAEPPSDKNSVERNIVVDEQNSVFSIGIPSGQKEQTEVEAEQPVNFWFEYLTADAKLVVNGKEVERNPFIFETKIGYTESVTRFNYEITNSTGQMISYNLNIVPAASGAKVAVKVHQKWLPE